MRNRLSNFKNLLNEEATLSNKIKKITSELSLAYEVQSQVSNFDNFENEIEIN